MDHALLQQEIIKNYTTPEIVFPSNASYDKDRVIANLRFSYKPFAIAYCKSAADVSECIQLCSKYNLGFRIRSGGHQHEGMCSANGIFLIDLSKMNNIDYGNNNNTAWIPAGIGLKYVYQELEAKNRIIPGGGCGSVAIGGLTQGGGWGPSARKLGLTCDNILQAEIVLASGEVVIATKDNQYQDLFWAIKGGGGGNFGVVTRFLFRLTSLDGTLTTFSICWAKKYLKAFVSKWVNIASQLDENLTTFCRVSVVDIDTADSPTILLGGQFYGTSADLKTLLKPFYDLAAPFYEKIVPVIYPKLIMAGSDSGQLPESNVELTNSLQHAVPNAPKETCDGPLPHKISSTFPKSEPGYEALVSAIVDFITRSKPFAAANTYLSLHGMGGAIKRIPKYDNAFPYKQKDFLLQFQAWWSDPNDPHTASYMNWIENFRETLIPYTEGSFINFPDVKLVENYETKDGLLKLLEFYYADNLNPLRLIKDKYDKDGLFSFGMGIPSMKA
ncbi:MAG: FAD-binding protein [Bacteroidota bacterium]